MRGSDNPWASELRANKSRRQSLTSSGESGGKGKVITSKDKEQPNAPTETGAVKTNANNPTTSSDRDKSAQKKGVVAKRKRVKKPDAAGVNDHVKEEEGRGRALYETARSQLRPSARPFRSIEADKEGAVDRLLRQDSEIREKEAKNKEGAAAAAAQKQPGTAHSPKKKLSHTLTPRLFAA